MIVGTKKRFELTIDKVGQHDTDCHHDLEKTSNSTMDVLGQTF